MTNEKEMLLAQLLMETTKLTKEANSPRGESKKAIKNYRVALKKFCNAVDIDPIIVDENVH